jgi:hypothetical protein
LTDPRPARIDLLDGLGTAVFTFALGWALALPLVADAAGKIDKALPNKKNEIQAMLRAGNIQPADEALFDSYFNDFLLEQFVNPWPGLPKIFTYSLDDLPRLRKDIKNFLNLDKTGTAYKHLNDLILKKITKKGGLLGVTHPDHDAAIKYNALLLLGDLNEIDASGKPKPWATPFPTLLLAATSPKAKDYMKVAAMVGIERYAAFGAIPQAKTSAVIDAMVALVNLQDPPANRDPAVHQYLRRSAGQILAYIGSPGPNNSVVKAFEKVVADPKTRPTMRCEMALFLGQIKYPQPVKVDLQQLANSLGHETVEVCRQEIDTAKAANRAPSRRILLYAALTAKEALGGSDSKGGLNAAAAGAPAQKFIGSLYGKVKALQIECESSDTDTLVDAEVGEVNAKLADLESVLAAKAAPKAEPVAAADRKQPPAVPAKQQAATQ